MPIITVSYYTISGVAKSRGYTISNLVLILKERAVIGKELMNFEFETSVCKIEATVSFEV